MPSITYWNRLEPRPRSPNLQRSFAAQVRDPLWFLTRQWQFGEFQGEDAASPAFVRFVARLSPIDGWRDSDRLTGFTPFDNRAPLEVLAEAEPFAPDVATAVELGQRFEATLARTGLDAPALAALFQTIRAAFPVQRPTDAQLDALADRALAQFLSVCAGRAIDGVALAAAARAALPDLPGGIVGQALEQLVVWERSVFGSIARADAPTWNPERLEYGVDVSAMGADSQPIQFDAHAGRHGEFEWYALDERRHGNVGPPGIITPPDGDIFPRAAVDTVVRSMLPTAVRFRGMPNTRWWHFEDGEVNFAAIDAEPRELAKLVLIDFMLVHGNDWFMVPFVQRVGTLCRVDSLLVHDVFGDTTVVERADRATNGPAEWSLYSTSVAGRPGALADYFVLPPTALATTTDGATLEDVRFLRDEMANMVWAVEHATENGVGGTWPGQERAHAVAPAQDTRPPEAPVSLEYRIQTPVPVHWIPFVPVLIDEATGDIALERAALVQPDGATIDPAGRILLPAGLADPEVYRIREEEVLRSGVRVSRVPRRTRWIDGSTHLWVARTKRAGGGEGSSGLRFDITTARQE
jgi:hypothetical protein